MVGLDRCSPRIEGPHGDFLDHGSGLLGWLGGNVRVDYIQVDVHTLAVLRNHYYKLRLVDRRNSASGHRLSLQFW